jgi:hypothetical protein
LATIPQVGRSLADTVTGTHDGLVNGSEQLGAALPRGRELFVPPVVMTDLERFWPSRRGHAFDELCRLPR